MKGVGWIAFAILVIVIGAIVLIASKFSGVRTDYRTVQQRTGDDVLALFEKWTGVSG